MLPETWKRLAHYGVMTAIFVALACQPDMAVFAWTNLVVQAAIFLVFACIPAYRTSTMSFVDGAWPLGLAALGVQTLAFGQFSSVSTIVIGMIYLVVGGRMALWSCRYLYGGKAVHELRRYQYQRIRWEKIGLRSERLSIQVEVLLQGAANATILAIPALLVTADPDRPFGVGAIIGAVIWAVFYAFESLADFQKARFGQEMVRSGERKRTCDVGLWRFSRHPNYFGQWMQWNAIIVIVAPLLIDRWAEVSVWVWLLTAFGLLAASGSMYYTLVVFTGAEPAEYYSARSRPDYIDYQRATNKFFPGPSRRRDDAV